jgi:hypothetical protein
VDNVGLLEQPDPVNQQAVTTRVVGTLYEPADREAQPVPAMLFPGGSGGGNKLTELAKHRAAPGFVTLCLCYFGCPSRPSALAQIPLEYLLSALGYLRDLPQSRSRQGQRVWHLAGDPNFTSVPWDPEAMTPLARTYADAAR